LQPVFFPLGFAPRTALENFWIYGLKFFWWWTAVVILSLVYLGRTVWRRGDIMSVSRSYLAFSFGVAGWIIPLYGSWRIQDSLDPNAVSIGSSYLRYWLPLFVLSTLPVALMFDRFIKRGGRSFFGAVVGLFALAVISGVTVFIAPGDGLSAVRRNLIKYQYESAEVFSLTEPATLIVVDYADKFIYPERSVIYPLRSAATYELLPDAVKVVPTYYYGLSLPERDLNWLQTEKLPPLGLTIEPIKSWEENSLYRFIPQQ
jgi:hypothetical protein